VTRIRLSIHTSVILFVHSIHMVVLVNIMQV